MKKYCRLCKKKESRGQCGFGPKMWDKYSVDDASDKEIEGAASDSGITEVNLSYYAEEGLSDWFGKSKSKDGKSGWVNVVTGGTCASDEPGEGTPKCVSSAKRASMSKAERESTARRKKAADPRQQQKSGAAKPTYVSTDPKKKKKEEVNTVNEADMSGAPSIKNAKPAKKTKVKYDPHMKVMAPQIKKEEMEVTEAKDKPGKGSGKKDACYHKVKSRYSVWPSAYASGALVKCRKKGAANWGNSSKKEEFQGFTEAQIAALEEIGAIEVNEAGQKCWKGYEKKGTKKMFGKTYNNCVKKEGYAPGDVDQKVGAVTSIPKSDQDAAKARLLAKAKAKREKMKKEDVELTDAYGDTFAVVTDVVKPEPLKPTTQDFQWEMMDDLEAITEASRLPAKTGNVVMVVINWRGRSFSTKMFFPQASMPKRKDIETEIQKLYPDSRVVYFALSNIGQGEPLIQVTTEDWQKVNKKDKTDGMSPDAVKAYRRENPGSKLKTAVTGDPKPGSKDSKRRKSYCSRSKGQQDMHNIDCSKTPDKAICKARRRWKC